MKIIECPRDAMQGLKDFIPTEVKIDYINELLKVGFDTIDFGSFVSPRAIPQMADTAKVLNGLDLTSTKSNLLGIVPNTRGAQDAAQFDEIRYLGFPFSISETFQKRNTNATIEESLAMVGSIQEICQKNNKELLVYISMAFGNPYDDPFDVGVVEKWTEILHNKFGVNILALSDTIGVSNKDNIDYLFSNLIPKFSNVEFGAHLHTTAETWKEKVEAAFNAGCKRFDGAIKGFGGCPMAKDDLTGNMPTENMVQFFNENSVDLGMDLKHFDTCVEKALQVFPTHL
jgi:hydroxymethylglutaryl-CoA lyase